MSNQTTVNLRIAKATPGLIADINNYKAVSRAAESATIPFGVVVSRGSSDQQALVGGSETGIIGITIRSVGKEAATVGATTLEYVQTEAMAIMTEGYIYALCTNGATEGDSVKFNNAAGALGSGTPAVGETTIDNAKWDETIAAGQVGRLYLGDVLNLTAGA